MKYLPDSVFGTGVVLSKAVCSQIATSVRIVLAILPHVVNVGNTGDTEIIGLELRKVRSIRRL